MLSASSSPVARRCPPANQTGYWARAADSCECSQGSWLTFSSLEIDVAAHGDGSVGWKAEVGRRVCRVVREGEEQRLAPAGQPGRLGLADGATGQEVRRVVDLDDSAFEHPGGAGVTQRGRQVGCVGESETHGQVLDAVVVVAQVIDGPPVRGRDVWDVGGARGDDD